MASCKGSARNKGLPGAIDTLTCDGSSEANRMRQFMQGGGIKIKLTGIHCGGVIVVPGHVVIVEGDGTSPRSKVRLSSELDSTPVGNAGFAPIL